MPTYEYLCQTCSHRFETWQKMTDEPLTVCPECGSHIRRVLYPTGIIFKGQGFYVTDHKNNSSSSTQGDAKKSESSSDTTKGSESKAATSDAGSTSNASSSPSSGDNKATSAA